MATRLPQSRGEGGPASAKALIIAAPTRSQLAAVSAIKILLVGVERLILAPQLTQAIASFLTKTVTIFSVCCPHFWQRSRSMVQSAVEKFIKPAPGRSAAIWHRPKPYPKGLNFLQSVGGTTQLSVSGRHARLSDFIVDAFAACTGFLASYVVAQKLEATFRSRFQRHPADD